MAENDDNSKKGCKIQGDELHVGPEVGSGSRLFVRHTADHKILTGVMSPVPQGETPPEGSFNLGHIEGNRYRVEEASAKGPAKVNSPSYRNNWDGIFGKKMPVGEA